MIKDIILGVLFPLIVNEASDVSPWLARHLVRWAAARWTSDRELSAAYVKEWLTIVEERPGKLVKLITAVTFCLGAFGRWQTRTWMRIGERLQDRIKVAVAGKSVRLARLRSRLSARAAGAVLLAVFGFFVMPFGAGMGSWSVSALGMWHVGRPAPARNLDSVLAQELSLQSLRRVLVIAAVADEHLMRGHLKSMPRDAHQQHERQDQD